MREWITLAALAVEDWIRDETLMYLGKLNAELNRDMRMATFMKRWQTFIEVVLPKEEITVLICPHFNIRHGMRELISLIAWDVCGYRKGRALS